MKHAFAFAAFSLVSLIASVSGCALLEPAWTHPEGKTVAEFNRDAAECRYQWSLLTPLSDTPYIIPEGHDGPLGTMMNNAYIDPDFEAECLQAKGWRRKK